MVALRFCSWIIICASLFLGTGCTQTVISSAMRQQAESGLSVSTVKSDPEAYAGRTVIWGGEILDTMSKPDATLLKVAESPLDRSERPKDGKLSRGSFIAWAKYLDLDVYERGRKITVAGRITGKEDQLPEEPSHTYPVVRIQEIHLWDAYGQGSSRPIGFSSYPENWHNWGR